MVIGRAVIVELATGARLVQGADVMAGVGGIAPTVGPLLGGGHLAAVALAGLVLGRRRAWGS